MFERHTRRQLQSIVCTVQRVVGKYQGHVRQLITDDKGTVMILVFGLRVRGQASRIHSSPSVRGVRASLQIWKQLKLMKPPVHTAIGTHHIGHGHERCTV